MNVESCFVRVTFIWSVIEKCGLGFLDRKITCPRFLQKRKLQASTFISTFSSAIDIEGESLLSRLEGEFDGSNSAHLSIHQK